MLFSMLHVLPLLAAEIPQPQAGGPVQGPGTGPAPTPTGPGVPQGTGVVGPDGLPVSPPQAVPAPPGIIQDTEFYIVDPSDPESRITGLQLREGFHQIRQLSGLQSSLHTTQNELQEERTLREQLQQEKAVREEQERFATYIQANPANPRVSQPQPLNQFQQPSPNPGQQLPAGGQAPVAESDWMMYYGQPGTPNPDPQQTGNPVPNPTGQGNEGNPVTDPNQLIRAFSTMMAQNNAKLMTQLEKFVPTVVDQSVGRRFAEQQRQSGVQSMFSSGKQNIMTDLQQQGVSPEAARDIADKYYLSIASTEQASQLMRSNYESPQDRAAAQQAADQKIAQGINFFKSAVGDAVRETTQAIALRQQQEAQQQLMTGSYIPTVVGDLAAPNREIYDPRLIDQANAAHVAKAAEIAQYTDNLQRVAGAPANIWNR